MGVEPNTSHQLSDAGLLRRTARAAFLTWPGRLAVAIAVVLGVGTSAVTWAAVPSNGGTVSSCYNTTTGAVRVIDPSAGQSCTSAERALSLASTDTAGRVLDSERLGGLAPGSFVQGSGRDVRGYQSSTVAPGGSSGGTLLKTANFLLFWNCDNRSGAGASLTIYGASGGDDIWFDVSGSSPFHNSYMPDWYGIGLNPVYDGTARTTVQGRNLKTGRMFTFTVFESHSFTVQNGTCDFSLTGLDGL